MALPRLPTPRRLVCLMLPLLLLAAASIAGADGAVVSTSGEEPLPASRAPVTRPAQGQQQRQPPAPPAGKPCPHVHKCGSPAAAPSGP